MYLEKPTLFHKISVSSRIRWTRRLQGFLIRIPMPSLLVFTSSFYQLPFFSDLWKTCTEIESIDKQKLAARNFVEIVEVFQCHLLNYERRSWKTRKCSYFIADNYHLYCVFQLFWSEFCRQHQEWQNSCRKSNQFIITFYVYNNILH